MKKQTGFSLIELMIAMALGLIIIAATVTIYVGTVKGSADTIKSTRLNHDLEMALSLMMNDIRRAGHWGGAVSGSDAKNNPFMEDTDAPIANLRIPVSSCILYSYDADGNGVNEDPDNLGFDPSGNAIVVVSANEFYGFKLDGTTIRMRLTGTTTDSADCSNGNWGSGEIIDGDRIEITKLEFSLSAIAADVGPPATPELSGSSKCFNYTNQEPYYDPCSVVKAAGNLIAGEDALETRQVNIILTGRLIDDNSVIKTLTGTVKVRNDRFFTQQP